MKLNEKTASVLGGGASPSASVAPPSGRVTVTSPLLRARNVA